MKITNVSEGPRGVNTTGGSVIIEKGATLDVTLDKAELKSAKNTGWFSFGDQPEPEPETEGEPVTIEDEVVEEDAPEEEPEAEADELPTTLSLSPEAAPAPSTHTGSFSSKRRR